MIVDCHTHWGVCWAERHGDDPAEWLRVLDRHGVDRAILFGTRSLTEPDLCAEDNDLVARLAAKSPGRIIPVGTAWPQRGPAAVAEARRCMDDLGMKGLKFHPWLQGFSAAMPALGDLCDLVGERGGFIVFHDGTPPYCLSEQIAGLARQFPRTRFVLGHSGLLWNWRSAMEAARLENVWLCLCGPHLRAMEVLCERAAPERLLWGSDFGFSFADAVDYRLNLLRRARIADDLRARILGDNALTLLGSEPA